MKATRQLHDLGQSLWLDNITRGLLTSGTLSRYIGELSVTGLTSNPTIFDHAIRNADFYDDAIRQKALAGKSGEALFFELALEDLTQAADLFRSDPRRHRRRRRLGIAGGIALAGGRYRRHASRRRRNCMRARNAPIFSSRYPAPLRAYPRSRRRSSPACR